MNNPNCPYCGAEMRVKNMYETVAFICSCGAMSPVKDTKEEALAAAMTLAAQKRPMLKPLAFSQIADAPVVFLEDYDKKDLVRALPQPLFNPSIMGFLTVDQEFIRANEGDCGKRWRAWASEPTEEEREAAKWEA